MDLNIKPVTKEDLLKDINTLDVYKTYYPDINEEFGTPQLSPLREEENPSFALFVKDGEVLFNDFVIGGGDCFRFLQIMFGYTFFEAMSRVVIDFKLTEKYLYKPLNKKYEQVKSKISKKDLLTKGNKTILRKRNRVWNLQDMKFWTNFGIDLKTLKRYNVEPLSHIFVNDKIITCDDYTYAYIENKDGIETYKIYQPFKEEYKWLNNHNNSVWQGWTQLPTKGDKLIITKSLKDVMTITNLTGIAAVSLQTESTTPKEHIIDQLKNRFQAIWIWYDNDFDSEVNWGREFSTELANKFNLMRAEIPDKFKIKDPSDFCKERGKEQTIKLIKTITDLPF